MDIWCKNSAYQVMTNTRMGRTDGAVLQLHAARGGFVSGQILLRAWEDFTITGADIRWQSGAFADVRLMLQGYQLYNDGVPYPDRVLPMEECRVPAHRTQGILVLVNIPDAAPAKNDAFWVVVHTTTGDFTALVQLSIYAVQMPTPAQGTLDHEYFFNVTKTELCGGEWPVGSEEWWALMHRYALAMKELRLNTLSTTDTLFVLLQDRTRRVSETHWEFDFSLVNEFIRRFLEWGSFRRVCIGAPLQSLSGEHITAFDEAGKMLKLRSRSPEGEAYARELLQALHEDLKAEGWLPMMVMHIEDEPHESENWKWFRALAREYLPGVPCSEPLDEYDSALALAGECDEPIPRIDVYDQGADYFRRRQAAGDKVWCYSCCYPEENWYMNKFIDLPSRHSRMLYWAAYAQGITGFLHWGFNFWGGGLYGLDPSARFKGDGHIVYPDAQNHGVLHSNRGLATMQGTEEYELLCIAARRHPQEAKKLALRLVRSFSDFEDDPELLEQLRVQLLQLCIS